MNIILCDILDLKDSFSNSLTEEKVKRTLQECKIIFSLKEITVLQLTQLVSFLSSILQTVLPTQILLPTDLAIVNTENRNVLQRGNYSKQSGSVRTHVMDRKLKIL